jgi:hypothetical protein
MYIPKCPWSPWDARRTRWAIVEVGKDRSAAAIIPQFAHTLRAPAYKARIRVTQKNAFSATINAWREKDLRTVLAAQKNKCGMLRLNAPKALQLELIRQAPVRQGGEAWTEIDLDTLSKGELGRLQECVMFLESLKCQGRPLQITQGHVRRAGAFAS